MLPLINPRATDLGGLVENSAPSKRLSEGPDSEFAGLLNGPNPEKSPSALSPGDGKELPEDGKSLPNLQDEVESLDLPVDQYLPDSLVGGLQQTDSADSALALSELGKSLASAPALPPISSAIGGELALSQSAETALPLAGLAEIDASRRGDLAAELSSALVTGSGQLSGAASMLATEPQLIGRSSSGIGAENIRYGTAGIAHQLLPSSETQLMALSQQQRLQPAIAAVEQPISTSWTLAENSEMQVEVGKSITDLLAGATRQLKGGIATAAVSTPSGTLPANVSMSSQTPLTSPQVATTSTPVFQIGAPVQDSAWSNMLGERVLLMAGQQLHTAEIRLSPAELGPIRVNLVVDDGAAELTFLAQHTLTREAIEHALPRLRDMLSENGLSLGNATVTDQDLHKNGFGNEKQESSPVKNSTEEKAAIEEAEGFAPMRITQGLVDTFV